MITVEDYPSDYSWIPETKKLNILDWFSNEDRLYKRGQDAAASTDGDVSKYGRSLMYRSLTHISIAQEILREIDIYVEYNWVGHRGQYFLATRFDAEDQSDYEWELKQDSIGEN